MNYSNNGFYLEDSNSKFGTLIEAKEPIKLDTEIPCCVQIGKTVLTMLVRRPNENSLETTHCPEPKKINNITEFGTYEINNELFIDGPELNSGEYTL